MAVRYGNRVRLLFSMGTFAAAALASAHAGAQTAGESWAGCYAGVQLGGAWSHANAQYSGANPYNSLDPAGPVLIPEQGFSQRRAAFGGQLGCNIASVGPWVLGLEAAALATPMDKTINTGLDITGGGNFTGNVRAEISGIVSMTGRVGYNFTPDWLVYAKGGYAAAYMEIRGNITPAAFEQFAFSDSKWHNGWTAGGGVEYRLFGNTTLGLEYNYYKFSAESYFGAQLGLPDANQVRIRADADVHSVMARLNFYDPTSAQAQTPGRASALPGEFSSFVESSVKYSAFDGSRGPNTFALERGKANQVYTPVTAGIDYDDANAIKVESRIKGGYVATSQRTLNQTASYEGPVDTQTSINVVLQNFETIKPQFGLALNLPTGISYLPNNQRFTRIDPDLVEVGAYGAGFNINPTAGFVIGINENTALSIAAGYAWNGQYVREAIDLNVPAGPGAFDLKRTIDPGDVFTGNVNLTTQIGKVAVASSFAYMSESRFYIDGLPAGREGAQYTTNIATTHQLDERWGFATNFTWKFQERDEIATGGSVVAEPKNSNSHVVIASLEPSYKLTEQLLLALNYSFLWRDENFYDQVESQFIPAKTKHTAGLSAQYKFSERASFEVRGSHSWINERDAAILPVSLAPPLSAASPPELSYHAWLISTTATFKF